MEWQEHFAKEGFTHEMDNFRFAAACASNVNITATASGIKLDKPFSYRDFMPNTTPEESQEYDDEQLMVMASAAGGTRFECSS